MEEYVRAQAATKAQGTVRIYLPMKVDVKFRARFLRDLGAIRFQMTEPVDDAPTGMVDEG
jgi:hypothetical protein